MEVYQAAGLYLADIDASARFEVAPAAMTQAQFEAARRPGAHINGSLFTAPDKPIGTVIYGKTLANDAGNGFGFGTLSGRPDFGGPWEKPWDGYVSGYPGLIRDGGRMEWNIQDDGVFCAAARRSGVARKNERIFFAASAGNMTLRQFCDALLSLGMQDAVNLDGGGSSRLYAAGRCVNRPTGERVIANVIAAWEEQDLSRQSIVCVDAGHGVQTAGKRSPDGSYLEHEFNLDVARRLRTHLERCGAAVVMTREDENDVSLAQRCRISNESGADVFVSVHTNAASDGWSDAQGWSAHIIARGAGAEKLAECIRARAVPMLGCVDRGVKVDNFQVLRDTDCPAVLIEHGFHTNRAEVEKLKTAQYRELCALSDARGVADYLGLAWKEPAGTASGTASGTGVQATATRRQAVYDAQGREESGRYIDAGDRCTLGAVTARLLIEVEYPTASGTRRAYVKSLEAFKR